MNASVPSADLLATIIAGTRRTVTVRQARESAAALARRAEQQIARPGVFHRALSVSDRVNIIAECKRTPGTSSTTASRRPRMRLTSVDLPTLGRPTTASTGTGPDSEQVSHWSSPPAGVREGRAWWRPWPR